MSIQHRALKSVLEGLAGVATGLLFAVASHAQTAPLPSLIKIVVPFAAGSTADASARAIATDMAARLGNTVVVDNQPGASSFIGVASLAKAPKDGSVILLTSTSTFAAAATKIVVPVDVSAEMLPVAMLSTGPLTLAVSTQSNISSPAELVAAARANPGKLTHGSGGVGTNSHIAHELLCDAANIQILHVPYKSASLAVSDFASGRIDMMIGTYATVAAQVKAGRGRLIAVTTAQQHPSFPGVPIMASVAPGFAIDNWIGIFAPSGTPAAVVDRLNRELVIAAKGKEMRQVTEVDGFVPSPLSASEFAARVRETYEGFKKLAVAKKMAFD